MTKSPNTEAVDTIPDTIEKNANDQPRPQLEHYCIRRRASEIEDTISAQLHTHDLDTDTDEAIEIVSTGIAGPALARAFATIEHLSNKVNILSERVADIQRKQESDFESLNEALRQLRTASKNHHDSLTGTVDCIRNVLCCVHDEFHPAEDDGLDMNMSDRLSYLVDITENTGGGAGGGGRDIEKLREGFSTWQIAERGDRNALKKGVEKVDGRMERMEERMKGMGEMVERVLGAVEKMGRNE